jgi:Protein of unknown function (DUF1499)
MFKAILLSAIALTTVSAGIDKFPSFDFTHANCAMDATYAGQKCDAVFTSMKALLTQYEGGCPSKGLYKFIDQSQNTYFWVTRTTPVAKYVDDVAFEFAQTAAGCVVKARSRSQSLSYYDYSTNYCNMWNPLQNAATFSNLKVHDCKFPAEDPATVCLKY